MVRFGVTGKSPLVAQERLIRPTDFRPVVRPSADGREVVEMRWGLIPRWAKEAPKGINTFNARAEGLAEGRPMFDEAFRIRRCLLIGTSYIEYKTENGRKTPFEFSVDGSQPYAYAGLWEMWGQTLTCAMITTVPNEFTGQFHDRMPAILLPESYAEWLDPTIPARDLLHLLQPIDSDHMEAKPAVLPSRKSEQPSLF